MELDVRAAALSRTQPQLEAHDACARGAARDKALTAGCDALLRRLAADAIGKPLAWTSPPLAASLPPLDITGEGPPRPVPKREGDLTPFVPGGDARDATRAHRFGAAASKRSGSGRTFTA